MSTLKIIQPSCEYIPQKDPIAHVAKCARVCYGKEVGNDEHTYNALIKNNHLSMFRHESVYAIIPKSTYNYTNLHKYFDDYKNCPYIKYIFDGDIYISTNMQFIIDNKHVNEYLINCILDNRVDFDVFSNIECIKDILRYTFKIITQISTSRELNRVSPNNIAERSTRYVYEDGTICCPHWITKNNINNFYAGECNSGEELAMNYLYQCKHSFDRYKDLIDNGIKREDARGILPLDTATTVIYTYTLKEWKHIIDLRYYGSTGRPHPNTKIAIGLVKDEFNKLGIKL